MAPLAPTACNLRWVAHGAHRSRKQISMIWDAHSQKEGHMATDLQIQSNRQNSRASTGPGSARGKSVASRNAMRHGLLSGRLFLDDEDPAEFQLLVDELCHSLAPNGILEAALVERVAVTMWRQRRLVHAETAALTLARQNIPIAKSVSSELGRAYGKEIEPEHLAPFDADRATWCRGVLAEIERLEEIDLGSIGGKAPLVHAQLVTDADGEAPETFLASHKGGLTSYVADLLLWCRKELGEADARPRLLAIAEQVRAKRMVLPSDALELLARYQSTLDGQLYKALKALREAQEWRLKTLDAEPNTSSQSDIDVADAA